MQFLNSIFILYTLYKFIYIIDYCLNSQEISQLLPCLESQALPLQSEERAVQLKRSMDHYAYVHFQLGRLSPNLQNDATMTPVTPLAVFKSKTTKRHLVLAVFNIEYRYI